MSNMFELRMLFDYMISLFEYIYNLIINNWALSFSIFLSFVNLVVVTINVIYVNPHNKSEGK